MMARKILLVTVMMTITQKYAAKFCTTFPLNFFAGSFHYGNLFLSSYLVLLNHTAAGLFSEWPNRCDWIFFSLRRRFRLNVTVWEPNVVWLWCLLRSPKFAVRLSDSLLSKMTKWPNPYHFNIIRFTLLVLSVETHKSIRSRWSLQFFFSQLITIINREVWQEVFFA